MMEEWQTSFGWWVRIRRKSLNLTQEQLARQAGCSPAAIKKIEGDERRPSRQVAARLAECLAVAPAQRADFIRVARGELAPDHLPSPRAEIPAVALPQEAASTAQKPAPSAPPEHSLPHPATPIIGRERELAQITALLRDPHCRLLTLIGAGGVGKTRLAVEAALRLRGDFAGGACLAPLTGVDAPALIIPAIANALEMPFSGPGDAKRQLFQFLSDQQLLLVLDTMEHLLEGAPLFSELLQAAPGVKLLVTSREPLHLQAEWVFEVRGLPFSLENEPEVADAPDRAISSAARLFLQRARQAQADFDVADEDWEALARICRLVQGLPLALELAARWTRTLSLQDIAHELERGLALQAAGRPDPAARHSSMRAVFDHSWKLLSPAEQAVLKALAVFRGGFTRAAAEQISGANLAILAALVDKSLLALAPTGTKPPAAERYILHDLVQQYLAARLAENPDAEQATRRRHSRYYLSLLRQHEAAIHSAGQANALVYLNAEMDNLRLAWNYAVEDEAFDELNATAPALYYYFELQQNFKEAEASFSRAVERARARLQALAEGGAPPGERAHLQTILAGLMNYQAFFKLRPGENQGALALFQSSLALLRALPAPPPTYPLAYNLVHKGVVHWAMGEFDQAARDLQEGVALCRTLERDWLLTLALGFLGGIRHDQGDYSTARRLLEEAVALARINGDPEAAMLMVLYLSRTLMHLNEAEPARALLEEWLPHVQAAGNRWLTALGMEYLARILRQAGNPAAARPLIEESLRLNRLIGDRWSLTLGLIEYSRLLLAFEEYDAAQEPVREALRVVTEAGYTPIALECLDLLAAIYARQGRTAEALALAIHVLQHPAARQDTRSHAAALQAELSAVLSPQEVEAAHRSAEDV